MSFQMDRQKMYTMPIQFGPCLGPRQNSEGCTRASADSWGFRFLELEFQWDRGTPAQKELQALMYDPARQGDMNYKYIPQTGDGFTGCDVEYMTLTPKVTSYPEDVQTFSPPGARLWFRDHCLAPPVLGGYAYPISNRPGAGVPSHKAFLGRLSNDGPEPERQLRPKDSSINPQSWAAKKRMIEKALIQCVCGVLPIESVLS